MYNIQENVRIVISLLKGYNIHHIVISPGGTNIPISQAVQDDSFFHCYSIPDERSAMYFAIGLHLQTGEIIATSCTSAQATRNYIPGLTEAFYKHTPILAITTSKLDRYSYQEYMQAPDQTSLPKDAVIKSYDLPPITDDNTRAQCFLLAKEAVLELTHRSSGPIQLNLRIIDSENHTFINTALPHIEKTQRFMAWDSWDNVNLINKKILIIVGEHRVFSDKQKSAMELFCENHNSIVYVNHLSNYHGKYSINGNLAISTISTNIKDSLLKPDIIITIGGQTGDYSLYGMLCSFVDKVEHWRVAEDGNYVDTYNKLTKIFECSLEYFFYRMQKKDINSDHYFFNIWAKINSSLSRNIELPFSNLYAAQQLSSHIPENSYINFAILNSLRCWEYFELKPSIKCFANVAAFGIDGCLSTLIGESMNTNELCFMITGDLAFFYDMNSLGIRHIKNNVRILLINNNGGAEFKIMTEPWKNRPNIDPYISAVDHNGNAKGWAENCGFEYLSASSKEDFKVQQHKFISHNEKSIIFEIFTNADNENLAIKNMISHNKIENIEDKIKHMIKKVVGPQFIYLIKHSIKNKHLCF